MHKAKMPSGKTRSIQDKGNIAFLKPVWCIRRKPGLNLSQYALCSAKLQVVLKLSQVGACCLCNFILLSLFTCACVCTFIFVIILFGGQQGKCTY